MSVLVAEVRVRLPGLPADRDRAHDEVARRLHAVVSGLPGTWSEQPDETGVGARAFRTAGDRGFVVHLLTDWRGDGPPPDEWVLWVAAHPIGRFGIAEQAGSFALSLFALACAMAAGAGVYRLLPAGEMAAPIAMIAFLATLVGVGLAVPPLLGALRRSGSAPDLRAQVQGLVAQVRAALPQGEVVEVA